MVAYSWFKDAINIAVLVSTLTALVWYILAMVCLLLLRRWEPQLFSALQGTASALAAGPSCAAVGICGVRVQRHRACEGSTAVDGRAVCAGTRLLLVLGPRQLESAAPEELAARQARPAREEMQK